MNNLRLFDPGVPPDPDSTPTVQSVIDWFLERHNPGSPTADKERRRVLGLFCERFGPIHVGKLRGVDLVDFVRETGKPDKANNTIDRWYRTIKQPFHVAEQLGLIDRSPLKAVKSPRGAEGRDLTPVEFRALLRHATPPFRRFLIFLRFSGARPGEAAKIKWSDVRDQLAVIREHKTAYQTGAPRRIWLNEVTLKLLAWIKQRSESEYVFVNSYGGPWKRGVICKNMQTIRKRAGLGPDVKTHGTRHMFATHSIMNGCDVATVAELLGHTDIRTTSRYVHLAEKSAQMRAAADKAIGRGTNRSS